MTQSSLERIVWFSIGQITECTDPDKQKELMTSLTRQLTEVHEKLLSDRDQLFKQIEVAEKRYRVVVENKAKRQAMVRDIATVINKHSRENGSNTPDFILAEMMMTCLEAFEAASLRREKWYNKALSINGDAVPGERGDIRKPSAENTCDRKSPMPQGPLSEIAMHPVVAENWKALKAIYLEVPEVIADDLNCRFKKVVDLMNAIMNSRDPQQKNGDEDTHINKEKSQPII